MAERELKRRPAPQREAPEVEETEAPTSSEKAEKVVNPPSTPSMTNSTTIGIAATGAERLRLPASGS